ncbi:DNA polymerase Y family protein [Gluconacetobacter entanii]|uniref:DNA polymerase Y family protein n=1 Tax=Gluconacetobacter entanii TaxID=108528 RepID=A0ABT3K1B6_9PROT|nr:DNA polymerase Y family protein [Gluconacetobacter entanii]MCW4589188.1 DNA polymerase Y family protein [Gluconacetobacter entanii]MCW4592748.1 DNA polymerase Y family protein [Gluconacetobacter entanii]
MPKGDWRRVVSLYLPLWPTDRLRKRLGTNAPAPECPLVLAGREGRRRVVLSVDLAARRLGLRPGTPVAKAQALHPDLLIMDADPDGDRAGLERLALWFQHRIAPIVAPDPPDGIVLDTTGADHLHGGEAVMLENMVTRLKESGITARAAIADTWGAAHALARYGRGRITLVPPGKTAAAIADLPIEALRLPADIIDGLHGLATAMPVRDVRRLTRLLCDRIETIDPGFGIERMVLTASLAEPILHRQGVSALIEEEEADVSDLIDTLANRVGTQALYRFAPVESDVPERAVCRVPALAAEDGKEWPDHWPRPTRLLPRPEPIQTMAVLPDHPPVFFVWRGIRRRIRCADGPERVFGEWWKGDAELTTVRDYFRVEDTSGETFWVYRTGDGEHGETGSQGWFLHGLFE